MGNGSGDGGSSRADAKRATNGVAEEAVTADAARSQYDTAGLAMRVFSGKQMAFCYAELTCASNESYSVTQVGKGKWVLIKSS
jgi:hypothetical protein